MPKQTPAGTVVVARTVRGSRPVYKPSKWLKAAALAVAITLVAGAVQWSAAQRREVPRIIVAPSILAEPGLHAALLIQVGPPESLPNNSFLRLRGFPASVSLTEGHAIAPGAWAVPLFALASLKAVVPAGVSGRNEITISLVDVDGTTLAVSRTVLVVVPASMAMPAEKPLQEPTQKRLIPAPPPPPPALRSQELSGAERVRAERFLAQGAKHLDQGNISAARMFFQRAAEAGLAEGALRMAATFDPAELTRLDAVAVTPDRNEARKWYERARELGAQEAEERLARLAGN
jgi:hypothetical protein